MKNESSSRLQRARRASAADGGAFDTRPLGGAFTATLLAVLVLTGCVEGTYQRLEDPSVSSIPPAAESAYVVANGDLLSVRVYNQDAVSTRVRVSPDGTIAVPLVGEVVARGARPAALAKEIEARLKPFIVAPSVTVTLEETQPVRISVVGEVAHAGVYVILPGAGVLDALALAGGLTEYADGDRVFVLRTRAAAKPLRIRVSYRNLTQGIGRGTAFTLQAGDTVVVE